MSCEDDTANRGRASTPLVTEQVVIKTGGKAGWFSRVFFNWLNGILDAGNKRPLRDSDLFPLQEQNQTQKLVDCVVTEWTEELKSCSERRQKPALWRAVWRMMPVRELCKLLVLCLLVSVSYVSVLVLLWFFLRSLNEVAPDYLTICLFIAGIGFFSFVRALSVHHKENFCQTWGMRFKVAITGIVYRKILIVTRHDLEKAICKSAVNLVIHNASKMEKSVMAFGMLVSAAFETVASICILCLLIGFKALVGTAVFVIVVLYIVLIAGKMEDLERKVGSLTDRRLTLLNEVITGIRAVKMFGLEYDFIDNIRSIRRKEIAFLRVKSAILASFMALRYTTRSLGALVSFSLMLFTEVHLEAFLIFTLLMGFSILKFAVCGSLADSIRYLVDARIALTKAQAFLELNVPNLDASEEHVLSANASFSRKNLDRTKKHDAFRRKQGMSIDDEEHLKALRIRRRLVSNIINPRVSNQVSFAAFTCTWEEDASVKALKNVTLEVSGNKLVVVTGPVGSGKSSLLLSVIEELPPCNGEVTSVGRIAYVSHTPWVFSGTLRENVVFGRSFSPYLYRQVLDVCDLTKDLVGLPSGDMTRLGQHGASLSGGQRARVSLARALYSEADIYLLDDPLSSVDVKLGKRILDRCICGMLSDRLRILATHQTHFLNKADHVILLRRGKVAYQGSPSEVPDDQTMSKVPKIGRRLHWKSVYGMIKKGKHVRRVSSIVGNLESAANLALDGIHGLKGLQEVQEDSKTGSVGLACYSNFWKEGLNPGLFVVLVLQFSLTQASLVMPMWWLSHMAEMSYEEQRNVATLRIYAALVLVSPLITTLAAYCFYDVTLRAGRSLHAKMTEAVIKTPVSFFDINSAGRILNRFTRDVGLMDKALPSCSLSAVQIGLFSLVSCLVPVATNYWMLLAALPLFVVYVYYSRYYLKTSRELKRLESLKCSPLYAHISETVLGLETIRTCNAESQFMRQFYRYQDENTQAVYTVLSIERWIGLRLELVCAIYVAAVAGGAMLKGGSPAAVGLALTFALETLTTTQCVVSTASGMENMMTSVERVLAYTRLEPEPGYALQARIPSDWPREGRIEFEDVSLKYTPGGRQVLQDISLTVAPTQRVGIVGRSGAGKSSLVSALFRMPDPTGRVLIDGVDIGTLNLQVARRAMAVITQDPVLFCATLRKNLDLFGRLEDADLWSALEQVQMKALVEGLPGELDYEIKESGSNFSVGQRQLLCLARALLQKTKIVIMDEATANVDFRTDQMVQEVVREQFGECTVLAIAHRLNSVISYDKVLVLEHGNAVEFDDPQVLLDNRDGIFAQMAKSHDQALAW